MTTLFIIDDATRRADFGTRESVTPFGYRVASVPTALRMIDFGYCPDLIVRADGSTDDVDYLIPIAKRLEIPLVYYSRTADLRPPDPDFLVFHFAAVGDLFASIASGEISNAAIQRRTVVSLEDTRIISRAVCDELTAFGYG